MGRRPLYKKCSEQLTNFESVLNTSGERILGPEKPPNSRQLETEDHKSVKFVSQKEEIETFLSITNLNPENEVTGKSFYKLSFFF